MALHLSTIDRGGRGLIIANRAAFIPPYTTTLPLRCVCGYVNRAKSEDIYFFPSLCFGVQDKLLFGVEAFALEAKLRCVNWSDSEEVSSVCHKCGPLSDLLLLLKDSASVVKRQFSGISWLGEHNVECLVALIFQIQTCFCVCVFFLLLFFIASI